MAFWIVSANILPAASTPEPVEDPSPEVEAVAKILMPLADGGSPVPQTLSAKPAFQIQESTVVSVEGHTIVFHQGAPVPMPAPPQLPRVGLIYPTVQGRLAVAEELERSAVAYISATVYMSKLHPERTRTLLRIWSSDSEGNENEAVLWSSANWKYLGGFAHFQSATGRERALLLGLGTVDADREEIVEIPPGEKFQISSMPVLPEANASFVVVKGNPTAETLLPVQTLHEIYNSELAKLKAACEGREAAQRPGSPPAPLPPAVEDTIIHYWPKTSRRHFTSTR